jgi:hypothetical protein
MHDRKRKEHPSTASSSGTPAPQSSPGANTAAKPAAKKVKAYPPYYTVVNCGDPGLPIARAIARQDHDAGGLPLQWDILDHVRIFVLAKARLSVWPTWFICAHR